MFILHDKVPVSTQKRLGINGTSLGQRVVNRTLQTRFPNWLYKIETAHLHGCIRGSDVHPSISERRSKDKTYLHDMKMHCSTYQTQDNTEVKASSRSLGNLTLETDIEIKCKKGQNLSLDRFLYGVTVVTVSSQETTTVFCLQGSRITGKFFHGSMEICQRY